MYISGMKIKKSKSINGYATLISLVCFFFMLQLASMVSIYILESSWLLKASAQNQVDLSLMHHAKVMIEENRLARLCSDASQIETEKTVEINGKQASFYDRSTYIEVFYEGNTMWIYYDESSLYDMEWK